VNRFIIHETLHNSLGVPTALLETPEFFANMGMAKNAMPLPRNLGAACLKLALSLLERAVPAGRSAMAAPQAGSLGDFNEVWEIRELRRKPRNADARQILEKVARQVKPIMRKRGWRVKKLAEFW